MRNEELLGVLQEIAGQGGGGGTVAVDSGYSRIRKISDYFYEIWFDKLDEDFAKKFFRSKMPVWNFGSNSLHRGVPGCSSFIKDGIHGRNFDWLYSLGASFLCHTQEKDGRYATIGIGGQINKLTESFVSSGEASEYYKAIPYMITDGINSQGLTISILIVPDETGGNDTVNPSGNVEEDLCVLQLSRYVLDTFATSQQAIEYLTEHVSLYHPRDLLDMGYNVHFVIGDKNETYLVEFEDGGYITQSMKLPYATNFLLNKVVLNDDRTVLTPGSKQAGQVPSVINNLQTYASGLERYNVMAQAFENVSSADDIDTLMRGLRYTKSYNTAPIVSDPYWYTEFVGNNDLTVDSDVEDFADAVQSAGEKFANRSRDPQSENFGTWQTTHTAIYDLENLTVDVYVQEQDTKYTFNIKKQDAGLEAGKGCTIDDNIININDQVEIVSEYPEELENKLYVKLSKEHSEGETRIRPVVGSQIYYKTIPGVSMIFDGKLNAYEIRMTSKIKSRNLKKRFGIKKGNDLVFYLPLGLAITSLLEEFPILEVSTIDDYTHYSMGESTDLMSQGLILQSDMAPEKLPNETFLNGNEYVKVDLGERSISADGTKIYVDDEYAAGELTMLLANNVLSVDFENENNIAIVNARSFSADATQDGVAISLFKTRVSMRANQNSVFADIDLDFTKNYEKLDNLPAISGNVLMGDVDLLPVLEINLSQISSDLYIPKIEYNVFNELYDAYNSETQTPKVLWNHKYCQVIGTNISTDDRNKYLYLLINDVAIVEYEGRVPQQQVFTANIIDFSKFAKLSDLKNPLHITVENGISYKDYLVPNLTAENVKDIYDAMSTGQNVIITDNSETYHFSVKQADTDGDNYIICFDFCEVFSLIYTSDGINVVISDKEFADAKRTNDLFEFFGRHSGITLEECSWQEIKFLVNNNLADKIFNIGDEKTVMVNNQEHKVRIIGFNHDTDSSGNRCGITFEFVDLISDENGYSLAGLWKNTNTTTNANFDYPNSTIRKNLTGKGSGVLSWYEKGGTTHSSRSTSVLEMLPNDLLDVMCDVKKLVKTKEGISSNWVDTEFVDKLFLLATSEKGFTSSIGDGYPVYDFYRNHTEQTDEVHVKQQVKKGDGALGDGTSITDTDYREGTKKSYAGHNNPTDGHGSIYWLRTPNTDYAVRAWCVWHDGKVSDNLSVYNYAFCVAPAFCI